MTHPLVQALIDRHGFSSVDESTVDAFLEAHEHSVLFFPGDANRLVETADVAVILPEIIKIYRARLAPALVAASAERALQRRYRFNAFPALVFSRGTGYLGVLSRILDWQDYLSEIPAILARDVSEPPPFRFPDGCAPAGMASPREATQEGDFA